MELWLHTVSSRVEDYLFLQVEGVETQVIGLYTRDYKASSRLCET